MLTIKRRWEIAPHIPDSVDQALANYHPVLRQILYNRGYQTPEDAYRFLMAERPPGADPFSLKGISAAIDRILFAIQKQEAIAIYGDYDVDGVTATALLVQFLEGLGANVRGYIPNRFEEGYGLNKDALSALHDEGIRLVITVDCGIRSLPEAQHAHDIGLDMIITDHHHPANEIPTALAVVNPKQEGDYYPDKDLAGVGIAYKLVDGLVKSLERQGDSLPEHLRAEAYADLVALGTVSDLAPLRGENRALVKFGIEQIRQQNRQGLRSLIGVANLTKNITAMDISYVLGPRLNASGRLDSALASLRLLLTHDVLEAGKLAQQLDNQNRERQDITRQILLRAEEMALTDENKYLLFAASHDFNPGVVGLVASRLTEQYYRPSIVAQQGEEFTRGSCRSIPEFHITDALDQCAELMEHHGGHAAAAGFTIRNENLPELIRRLKKLALEQLADQDLQPKLRADMELPLYELRPELLEVLEWLQPTGSENPPAVFVSRHLKVTRARKVGKEEAHLKLTVTDGQITYDAIAFKQSEWYEKMPNMIDLLYNFEVNEFNGHKYLQLNVRDICASS